MRASLHVDLFCPHLTEDVDSGLDNEKKNDCFLSLDNKNYCLQSRLNRKPLYVVIGLAETVHPGSDHLDIRRAKSTQAHALLQHAGNLLGRQSRVEPPAFAAAHEPRQIGIQTKKGSVPQRHHVVGGVGVLAPTRN